MLLSAQIKTRDPNHCPQKQVRYQLSNTQVKEEKRHKQKWLMMKMKMIFVDFVFFLRNLFLNGQIIMAKSKDKEGFDRMRVCDNEFSKTEGKWTKTRSSFVVNSNFYLFFDIWYDMTIIA